MHPRQSQRTIYRRPYTFAELRQPIPTFIDPDLAPSFEPTVEGLAEAMRRQFPNCDEQSLQAEGFTLAFQRQHGDAARELANKDFVKELEPFDERAYRIERAANLAAGLITDQGIATHLLANGYRPRELGEIMPDIIARMCEIVVGRCNAPQVQ